MEFVDNDYGYVSNESFNLAFEEVEIERRLNDLKQLNKQKLILTLKDYTKRDWVMIVYQEI